jgi:Uncharacterized conserved protein
MTRKCWFGPRMNEGEDGFIVVTPLEREGQSTVLVEPGLDLKEAEGPKRTDLWVYWMKR